MNMASWRKRTGYRRALQHIIDVDGPTSAPAQLSVLARMSGILTTRHLQDLP